MDINIQIQGKATIVAVSGRLDSLTSPIFDEKIRTCLASQRIILDLQQVDYISSAGLRSILVAAKKIKDNAGQLELAGLKGGVKEVFEISGLSSIFKIYPSVQEALLG
jgi:anti-anti-sigma factor